MSERSREEKNRILAEWLGSLHKPGLCLICGWPLAGLHWWEHCAAPNFYTSEEASALLLDKINNCREGNGTVVALFLEGREICCYIDRLTNYKRERVVSKMGESDRKTAIAEAAVKWVNENTTLNLSLTKTGLDLEIPAKAATQKAKEEGR